MAINLSEVKYTYASPRKNQPSKFVLDDINLDIAANDELIAVVGGSGAGKSTLVQLFNALLMPSFGKVVVFDRDTLEKKLKLQEVRKKVGLVFQFPEYQLFEETIIKDVAFGPLNFGMDDPMRLAQDALSMVGIDELLYQKNPFNLSGGQKRRVAIAGILASNPDILVFDEPTVGLDPEGKKELLKLLKKLNEEHHKTIIIITHDMDVVGEISKRVLVLKNGHLVFDGSKDTLFKNEEFVNNSSLDYPNTVKILKAIKQEFKVDIDEYQYTINDVYQELTRVFGNE